MYNGIDLFNEYTGKGGSTNKFLKFSAPFNDFLSRLIRVFLLDKADNVARWIAATI